MIKELIITITVGLCASATELFITSDSDVCKKNCIDENNYFCPNAGGDAGVCCSGTTCKSNDFCSYHAPIDNESLKYWACPHDPSYCGLEYNIVPQYNIAEFIKLRGDYENKFNFGQMCKYKLMFPSTAGEFDQIVLLVSEAIRSTIYATETDDYSKPDTKEI